MPRPARGYTRIRGGSLVVVGDRGVPAGAEALERGVRRDTLISGKAFVLHIPFKGDRRVFKHMSSRFIVSGHQKSEVRDDEAGS